MLLRRVLVKNRHFKPLRKFFFECCKIWVINTGRYPPKGAVTLNQRMPTNLMPLKLLLLSRKDYDLQH
ncbi:MAG: hypothetical protein RIR11_2987 [Bacteroidota bacterium]|jgi:hypothetical protein